RDQRPGRDEELLEVEALLESGRERGREGMHARVAARWVVIKPRAQPRDVRIDLREQGQKQHVLLHGEQAPGEAKPVEEQQAALPTARLASLVQELRALLRLAEGRLGLRRRDLSCGEAALRIRRRLEQASQLLAVRAAAGSLLQAGRAAGEVRADA